MKELHLLVIAFALTAIAVYIFYPAIKKRSEPSTSTGGVEPQGANGSTDSVSNLSQIQRLRNSRWFWNVSQLLFVLVLKIITILVLVSLKVDVANDATSLLPILLNVWLSRYLVFQKKLNISRWVISGFIYFVQVMLGLSIGIFSA